MNLIAAFNQLFFPRVCSGCGSDALGQNDFMCFSCFSQLPYTCFNIHRDNKTEKIFYGRVDISYATSLFYFSAHSIVQNLIHELKYNGQRELGIVLGRMMGKSLAGVACFDDIDFIVPLPLSARKKKERGYNQSALLCEGISQIIKKPVLKDKILRTVHSPTQTKKHRKERWQNVEGIFSVADGALFENKHTLLVDDVLTTGATLEACASAVLQSGNARVSVATLAIATR